MPEDRLLKKLQKRYLASSSIMEIMVSMRDMISDTLWLMSSECLDAIWDSDLTTNGCGTSPTWMKSMMADSTYSRCYLHTIDKMFTYSSRYS